MWRCDNVGCLGAHATCHVIGFLVHLFNFLNFILRLARSQHQWSDFDDLYVIRRVSAQGSVFWVLVHIAPYSGAQIPKNT